LPSPSPPPPFYDAILNLFKIKFLYRRSVARRNPLVLWLLLPHVTRSITVRKLDPDFLGHNFYLLVGHQYLFSLLDYVNLMRIRVQHFVWLRMRIRIQMRIHILGSSVNLMKYLFGIFCFIFYLYLLFLVSFGRACAPMRCAHLSFWVH
jgi:hypothetical protein